jgi:hypothetical protein
MLTAHAHPSFEALIVEARTIEVPEGGYITYTRPFSTRRSRRARHGITSRYPNGAPSRGLSVDWSE